MQQLVRNVARDVAMNLAWPMEGKGQLFPDGAILHWDASKNKPLLPVTYNGKYLVVKNV